MNKQIRLMYAHSKESNTYSICMNNHVINFKIHYYQIKGL